MPTINPEALKQRRKRANMSLDALEEKSGINRSTISRIELGRTKGQSHNTVGKLAKALRCTAEELAAPPDAEENDGLLAILYPRSATRLKMSDAAQNALHLVATRYQVGPEEVLDLAALLFDLAAMESLLHRRKCLMKMRERRAELAAMGAAFPHLSEQLVQNWDGGEIDTQEEVSIKRLDIRSDLIECPGIDPRPLDYDEDSDNPFIQHLRTRAARIAQQFEWSAQVEGWSLGRPDYRICEPEAAALARGDEQVADYILDGKVKVVDLPPSLRTAGKEAERLDWLREQVEAYHSRFDAFFPDLGLPNPLLDDLGDADGEGKV